MNADRCEVCDRDDCKRVSAEAEWQRVLTLFLAEEREIDPPVPGRNIVPERNEAHRAEADCNANRVDWRAEALRLRTIVDNLAKKDPFYSDMHSSLNCGVCHAFADSEDEIKHDVDCPWLAALTYAAERKDSTP